MPAKGMTARRYLLSRGWRESSDPKYFRDYRGSVFVRRQAVVIQRGRDKRCLSLPALSHDHCDPVCENCRAIIEDWGKRAEPVISAGLVAFWDVVRAHFPRLKGGPPSFTALETDQMRADARAAIQDWLFDTDPKRALTGGGVATRF